ncbi:hypothetical protein NMY22_g3680 [Coprinellus aureogranulatus]|nr:hypothetical protein NMY22_g3680 [Coprinellus aureogranulatus]
MSPFTLSRSSSRSADSRKSLCLVDHGLQPLHNNPSYSLSPQVSNSGTKAEMMDPEDQAWGSAPSHRHRQHFRLPTFGSHKH